jgi:outer membrane protease
MSRASRTGLSILCAAASAALPVRAPALHALQGPDVEPISRDLPAGVSVRASLGILQGQSRRLDYVPDAREGRRRVGDARWDLSALCLAGAEATVEVIEQVRISVGAWAALNEGNGQMEEYRWLWTGHDWSHWQRGEADVRSGGIFDLNVAADFYEEGAVTLSGVGGWKHNYWAWRDRGLWYRESELSFRDSAGSHGGRTTVDYEQALSAPYAGLGARMTLEDFDLEAYLTLSPLARASDRAHYWLRDTARFPGGVTVESRSSVGVYAGGGVSAVYSITESLFVGAALDGETFPRRLARQKTLQTNETVEEGTALSSQAGMLSAHVGWRF